MKSDIFNRCMIGIAFGALVTFGFLTVFQFVDVETSIEEIWRHMLASMILGIYYGLSSFIWTELEKWSPLKKTVIHFSASITVYFIIAFTAQWVPIHLTAIITSTIIFTMIYAVFWMGYRIYFKRVEASLNRDLQNKS